MELVTAYTGKNHVTAAQIADFNRGIYGNAAILDVGNKLEASIQTANRITIKDGVAVFDGREVYVAYGKNETVNITSGTQDMKRYDIIAVVYEKDARTGVEKVTLKAITGTPNTMHPSDPQVNDLDIRTGILKSEKPLYRVRLNGTAIEGIDALVEVKGFGKHNFVNPIKTLTETREGYALDAIMGKELKKQITAKCSAISMGGYGNEWQLTQEWKQIGNYIPGEETDYYKSVQGSEGYIEIKQNGVYLLIMQASIHKKTSETSGVIWSEIRASEHNLGGDTHFMPAGAYYDTLKFVTYQYLTAGARLKLYIGVDQALTGVYSVGKEYLNIIRL
ncbi:putative uncharacterized protein [Lachnospiraceae bacterium CAG:364]|nr:putative uncharacterized protein [Lachnospiraceae bacterium CAG:364]